MALTDGLFVFLLLLPIISGTEEDRLASRTLYIGNIPYSFREPEVEEMFKKFGTIVKITVVLDQYTGRNKGYVIQILGAIFITSSASVDLTIHVQNTDL